ncbi:MAG: sarcosine oxidase subunit gamma [Gammaproteobacteria bacterium]|nr:sarcosine oxidase subunit gamma [Gammaproteobacteria bacterium]MBU2676060.1 sarcosine oxidase subunit gamma [Gammaproteobacteria bacterium]NNC58324.1 sarcosine oxidase subunit gamma [Woeseiaceae bacterium]NNL49796.1 sarcosine oxidase subunit gamma [Woeseiaceae bacterium]
MSDITRVELGHINLRGNASDTRFTDGVAAALGQDLPLEPNTISRATHRVYWLGPDEWQIVAALESIDELLHKLRHELAGQHVAINELSGGQTTFHLSGSNVPGLLAKGCTLDLHPSVFRLGHCAQSGLAKAIMLLGCIDEAPVYEIIVRRSFSEYALRWLSQD